MSRKPDGTQRSGRFTAPSAAGGFGGSDTALTRLARPFTPKPFRSTGGMSTSADTMMSIGMGRHNTDDELPEDQINIGSIVSRKTSDRRYLPRKIGNMKKYLHTISVTEALDLDCDQIHNSTLRYERLLQSLNEEMGISDLLSKGYSELTKYSEKALGQAGKEEKEQEPQDFLDQIDKPLRFVSAFLPFGDLYYAYRAFREFGDIEKSKKEIEDILKKLKIEIDMTAPPGENSEVLKNIPIPTASDREFIKDAVNKLAMLCYNFLTDAISGIPLEVFPSLAIVDSGIDTAISSISAIGPTVDPTGEKLAKLFFDFSLRYNDAIREIETNIRQTIAKFPMISDKVDETKLDQINKISNFIGNLALIHAAVSSGVGEISKAESPVFAESRLRKKKKRADEMSTTASVAGYSGPVKGPGNPRQFYSTMARAAGGEYLVDPIKSFKAKP